MQNVLNKADKCDSKKLHSLNWYVPRLKFHHLMLWFTLDNLWNELVNNILLNLEIWPWSF